jgi:hypothetical protein
MTEVILQYTFQDFESIKDDGFSIELPDNTIEIINKIAEQVGSQGYIKTPFFKKNKKKSKQPIDPSILENMTFKNYNKTEEEPITIETFASIIKSSLNKLSKSNYDKLYEIICDNMNKIIDITEENDEEPFVNICNYIFEYATSNKMGVEMYAKLYICLMEKYPILRIMFDKKFANYITMFNKIEQKDPKINDYNHFCNIQLINQKRRVFSLFIIELYKYKIVEIDNIINIIISLQTDLLYSINWNNESSKCEEISENISLFISKMYTDLLTHKSWENIEDNIMSVKNSSVKDHISMTNKIKFKHMDMLDAIKKQNVYKPPSTRTNIL